MELAKWGVLIVIGIIVTAGTAVVSMRGPHWKRVMMFIMVWSMFAFPIMTLDFHFNARHNVRGWEFCWPDFIGLGLLIGHFASGKGVRGLFGITSIALAIHSFVLLVSAFVGVDTLFSMFYLNRFFRMAFMFVVIAVVVQDNKDRMALMLGFVGFLLFNMAAVLEQKYVFGRFQSTGLFDHQNAMAMCVTLVTPALFALILLQGYEKRLFVFLLIACGAGRVRCRWITEPSGDAHLWCRMWLGFVLILHQWSECA